MQVTDAINKVYKDVDLIKNKELVQFQPELKELLAELTEKGITSENAMKIINEAKDIYETDGTDPQNSIADIIARHLGQPSMIELSKGSKKTIFFVGPTGVGKTTTLAKIAALFSLKYNTRVGLVTEDTYRIGAVEQLKIYADIMDLPLSIVYNPKDMIEILDKMDNVDLVLFDTAGKSPLDKAHNENLKALFEQCENREVYLVVSSVMEQSAVMSVLENYSFTDYKIIFTKLDESEKWGNILNVKMHTDKQLSYLTIGQNVADDILPAYPDYILKRLITDGGEIDGPGISVKTNSIGAERKQAVI